MDNDEDDDDDDAVVTVVGGIIDCNRSLGLVIGCLTFRLKSLPNRSETASFVAMPCFCTGSVALSIFKLPPLVAVAIAVAVAADVDDDDDFHLEPSILNDARTDLLRRSIGDGVESGRRRYVVEWSFSLFISITFVFFRIHSTGILQVDVKWTKSRAVGLFLA